jgi:hypothetical protein
MSDIFQAMSNAVLKPEISQVLSIGQLIEDVND